MATKEDIILTTINKRFDELFLRITTIEGKMDTISSQSRADDDKLRIEFNSNYSNLKSEMDRSLSKMWISIRKLEKFVWMFVGGICILQFLGIAFLYKLFMV